MGFLNLVLLVLFLFALAFQPFFLVKPDDALIRYLCGRTEQPVICSDCLRSDPGSGTADGRGLAVIAIRCAEKDTTLMAQMLYDQYKSTPDPTLEKLLNECWLAVYFAAGDFSGMARIVGEGDYGSGKEIIDEVLAKVNSCLDGFNNNPSVAVPSAVLAGTLAANQNCKIVLQILNNI